ncbi:MAG: hypothetical protein ABI367_00255 [Mucilaginibacter sp.]
MKRTIIIVSICIFSVIANAQKNLRCIFFYDPITSLSENDLYQKQSGIFDFITQYKNLKDANVSADFARAMAHKDARFVALSIGKIYSYPGVSPKQEALIKRYKFKVIQGTGSVKFKKAPPLQSAAALYAKKYNEMLLRKINAKDSH